LIDGSPSGNYIASLSGDKTMNNQEDSKASSPHVMKGDRPSREAFSHLDVARTLKADYIAGARDPSMRALDTLHSFLRELAVPGVDVGELTKKVVRLIFTQFNLREVSIGLRGPDGVYRYVAQHGMRAEVWAAHQKLSYTDKELFDPKKYRFTSISKYTRLFLAEDSPYDEDELATYSEHLSNKSVRRSPRDSKEGDYMDFIIFGPREEILGWIETSGTWDGHIPDVWSIRCIEVVASLVGIALTRASAEQTGGVR